MSSAAAQRGVANLAPPSAPARIRYQPLLLILAALTLGIVADRFATIPQAAWLFAATGAWCLWFVASRIGQRLHASICLLACMALLGGAWHHARWRQFAADDLGLLATDTPTPICFDAITIGGPRLLAATPPDPLNAMPRGDRSRLAVQAVAVRAGRHWQPISGRVWVRINGRLAGIQSGDRVRIFGSLAAPSEPLNPGDFDFASYQRTDRVLAEVWVDHPASVSVVERAERRSWLACFERLRHEGDALLARHVPPPRVGTAAALLLGRREQLDPAQNDAYFRTGMIHLLSISGLHIGILAWGLMGALRLGVVGRSLALAGVASVTAFYALVIDAEPPAVRATVIVGLGCASLLLGRTTQAFQWLAAAGLAVLAWSPAELFRAGPQLSFLAAGVLAWFAHRQRKQAAIDPLDRLIAETRPWYVRAGRAALENLGNSLRVTCTIWAVALPLVLWHFHLVSPAAIGLTPLLAIPVAVVLFAGFGVLLTGWICPPLADLCGWFCDRGLALIEGCVQFGVDVPGNHFWLGGPGLAWIFAFYGLLAAWMVWPAEVWRAPRRWALAACGSVMGIIPFSLSTPAERPLTCTMLAVGHGGAVVVEMPNGQTLLYDCGRLGPPALGAQSISNFLFSRRIRRLDAVVISHADVDHYNALPELLRRFSVGNVYVTPTLRSDNSLPTQILLEAIRRAGVPCLDLAAGDRLSLDPRVSLDVLHPPPAGVRGNDNANSIVLLIEHAQRRILLPGDLESPGLDRLLAMQPIDCDVLLAPHHGSPRSNPAGCAAWCRPEHLIISGGAAPVAPTVRVAYERLGARVYHTARDGAVISTFTSDGYTVEAWRSKVQESRSATAEQ